jgi:hypothetical protein
MLEVRRMCVPLSCCACPHPTPSVGCAFRRPVNVWRSPRPTCRQRLPPVPCAAGPAHLFIVLLHLPQRGPQSVQLLLVAVCLGLVLGGGGCLLLKLLPHGLKVFLKLLPGTGWGREAGE